MMESDERRPEGCFKPVVRLQRRHGQSPSVDLLVAGTIRSNDVTDHR